ncbi:LacI family DNA-binding transcriptional regulator [Pseudonocardia sp. TRM90224]|uniref:LacI family DNA-binding transcriptional regulator n=1 Tax=Pseudonocardia sp. TRM90224 TaxID=2812678 RepID=UPI001E3DDB80|nr:LacI family DNA-binding transcriptional regulator [Pseudonocardia sp. TRM90224]
MSLKHVAAVAGVSPSTASRVLAGVDRNVDPELARRVRLACDELGYRVNAAARALRLQSTGSVALVVPAIANAYFCELVAAYSHRLDAGGRRLVTIDTNETLASETRQLGAMDRVLVDAVLVVPVDHRESAAAINDVMRNHTVVQVDRVAAGAGAPSVRLDNAAGMKLLVEHLREHGRRRIALIDAQERSSSSVERVEAFRALAGPHDSVMQMASFSMSSGTEAASRLLADRGTADAVICTADVVAIGVLTALQHGGLRVPAEVAIASFDGTSLTDVATPGLTSLRSPVDAIVTASLEIIDGGTACDVVVDPALVVRGSTVVGS